MKISCCDESILFHILFQTKNPNVPAFFTNRALCHIKLKQWESANQDSKRAIELDSSLVKAHFFHGQALLELSLYDEAITSLTRGKTTDILPTNS